MFFSYGKAFYHQELITLITHCYFGIYRLQLTNVYFDLTFIDQITLHITERSSSSDNQHISLKAAFVLLAVALQKPSPKSKYCTLIYRTTPGREKTNLVPKSLPRPCLVRLSRA